jgi:hypothetical protein
MDTLYEFKGSESAFRATPFLSGAAPGALDMLAAHWGR